jgi:hypothetical protein
MEVFRRRILLTWLTGVALALTLGAGSASADTMITLSSADVGVAPYSGPYATADVAVSGGGTVATITFSYLANGGNDYLLIDHSAAAVNVNAASFTESFGSATNTFQANGFSAPSFVGFGSGNVDGFGNFNLTLTMFDGGDHPSTSIVFTVTRTDGGHWDSNGDNVLTANGNGALAAAHVAVFPAPATNGQQLATGYVANGGAISVPEPSTMAIAGLGALGFLGYGLRRRSKK